MADDTTDAATGDTTGPTGDAPGDGPRVAVRPEGMREHIVEAVRAGGGTVVEPAEAELLVWTDPKDPEPLESLLAEHDGIGTVQLLWAGVESFAARGMFDDGRTWACGKGVYADPVAEHALALLLAGMRGLPGRVTAESWGPQWGTSLLGGSVTILGGGGIAESLIRLLAPFETEITVVRRSTGPMDGVARVVAPDDTREALRGADAVVLALALTDETTGVIDAEALAAMDERAWLVNVARGAHVVTDDLVDALRDGVIAGAALDVTDPEPLPQGHPLWTLENCIITPHTANTEEMAEPLIADRVRRNVERSGRGDALIGLVDPASGY
ncbi:D-isomer specific 2-hydroxyacid dehydrogenase family protein [Ilumatobacter sp.]|uniref:D-isomer specific 2-hydroxyacid dehydrogenase family protein n=1 Tax=Ilumatobacter sp. TaxID=1967498 RepID=UPI003B529CD3